MLSIKQRLLAAIEQAPDPLLEETLTFLEFLITRTERSLPLNEEFDPDSDSKAQILVDLKTSLQQSKAGQTFAIAELWDGIDV
jgi:hypothetical protein